MSEVPLYRQSTPRGFERMNPGTGRNAKSATGPYRDYSKLSTHTALGSYSRAIPRSIGPP